MNNQMDKFARDQNTGGETKADGQTSWNRRDKLETIEYDCVCTKLSIERARE